MTSDAAQPRVYVVEDDDQLRLWVSRELRAHGYAVDSFASGNDFRRMLPMLRPGSVVTDLRMPGGDGMDLLSLLRPHWEKFPVIVMTAYADVPIAVQAMKLGAIDFIEKPFTGEALVSRIESVQKRLSITANSETGPNPRQVADIARARMATLAQRELEVLEGLVAGKSNKMIADDLNLSQRTVEVYRARLMKKMQARSVGQLVTLAMAARAVDLAL